MKEEQIVEEIRELRKDVQELRKEFYIFKVKTAYFIGSIGLVYAFAIDYIKKKIGL